MEDNTIRAITIGVGVLIAIATITIVLTYYNTAKESMSVVGAGNNLYKNYNKYIVDIITTPEARGTDVINLLNYFEEDNSVILNLINKDGAQVSNRREFRNDTKANERFRITVNDDSATNITVEAID